MDPVACAVCTVRQGVPRSANIFVCYSCHSANFLERQNGLPSNSFSPSPTASGNKVVVHKITDTFFKVEKEGDPRNEVSNRGAPQPAELGEPALSEEIVDPSLLSPKTEHKTDGNACCTVCMDHQADTVMLPCSHGGICYSCADALVRRALLNGGALCPHCRAPIASLIKLSEINDQVARGEEVQLPKAFMLVRRPN